MTIVSTYYRTAGRGLAYPEAYSEMSSSRQERPFVRASFERAWRAPVTPFPQGMTAANTAWALTYRNGESDTFLNSCRETAYSRLMGKALPSAAMAVNMAQGAQSWAMIAMRSKQLLEAWSALRRGKLGLFARILALNPNDVRRRTLRKKLNAEGTWLEFTFGWKPLIADVYNAVDVLQSEFPTCPVRGSYQGNQVTVEKPNFYTTRTKTRHLKVRLMADLRVTNPNLLLANQLGLLNPAAVAWDVIPFSFVVDWFLPVSRFIKTFNDQAGLVLLGQCTTITVSAEAQVYDSIYDPVLRVGLARGVSRRMEPFIKPGFPTRFKLPTASMWLAATSVSLLVQKFGK